MGSVAEEVVRRSTEPVVLVGPRFDPLAFAGVEHLVLCTDGSAIAERVVPVVSRLAKAADLPVEVITVRPPATEQLVDFVRPAGHDDHFEQLDAREAADVRRLAEALDAEG